MPLKKIQFKSGVNRENTRYTTEGGWYECDKIRFRQGTPEKIGGWQKVPTTDSMIGVCRSIWPWASLSGVVFAGLGTSSKYYIYTLGEVYDVTPLRKTVNPLGADPFATTSGLPTVVVTDVGHGAINGDYVNFSGASAVAGLTISGNYQLTYLTANTYSINAGANAGATTTGGGAAVVAGYEVHIGSSIATVTSGWGAGYWNEGEWDGSGVSSILAMRIWDHANFGEDLVFGPAGGPPYYWDSSTGTGSRGVLISSLPGADADVPEVQNGIIVSDASRFVLMFGVDDYGSSTQDPMLIRWSDQESATTWTPSATNQAGSLRLSHGSKIVAWLQVRQEILVWTDMALYSLQYVGPDVVWGSQILSDDITIANDRAAISISGVTYWMGYDKFYKFDGRVSTLECALRRYIFSDFNHEQSYQVFAGSIEKFNEVWWFYCSANSTTIDKYVVFNYVENAWYYGTLARTAWTDVGVLGVYPIAADYNGSLVQHEFGVDDLSTNTPAAISAYITSSEFDIEDGHRFGFIWRILPDITFEGSTSASPAVTLDLYPLSNSGSGYNNPTSVGGVSSATVTGNPQLTVEQFTGEVYTRVRGRQMAFKVSSNDLGVHWQLGAPRIDIRPDGRR